MAETATSAVLDTDLLTPLGAYLRLRGHGRASFLLESVEQGRLGRYSLVGAGSRLLSYEEAERCCLIAREPAPELSEGGSQGGNDHGPCHQRKASRREVDGNGTRRVPSGG